MEEPALPQPEPLGAQASPFLPPADTVLEETWPGLELEQMASAVFPVIKSLDSRCFKLSIFALGLS